jgi:phospholipid-transporting ATPase
MENEVYLAEGERRIVFKDKDIFALPDGINDVNHGKPNKVRTARFTMLTWLPKSLMGQFQRVANIYFLCIAVLVMFPWSPKDWKSKVGPFCMVLLWTALKDLHEDARRRADDKSENSQKCMRFECERDIFRYVRWEDVQVGDVLLVKSDEAFPADLILLYAGGGHEAFISTISLDGETNLKERQPPPMCEQFKVDDASYVDQVKAGDETVSCNPMEITKQDSKEMNTEEIAFVAGCSIVKAMNKICFSMKVGRPEVAVSDVKGSISTGSQSEVCPIAFGNFLPRGCTLRNTTFIVAVAIYVGADTKTRLNSATSSGKISNMQEYLNYCVWGLLVSLVFLCSYAATLSALQEDSFTFCCGDTSLVIRTGIFTITFYHVVPMSLYVCFEMLKLTLIYQVNNDTQMVDPTTGDYAVARTSDLIEEMGQIDFIFSDKTGTLTKNEMVFARACISGTDVGDFRKPKSGVAEGVAKCKAGLEKSDSDPFWKDVRWFFTCLATCHSVQISKNREEGDGKAYQGMSPDEVSLVESAAEVGIVLKRRSHSRGKKGRSSGSSELTLEHFDAKIGKNREQVYSVLHELDFTSDRKRMSVVLRVGSEIFLVTKGADSVMEELVTEPFSDEYHHALKEYSSLGLRTLIIAYKKVERAEFRQWEKAYKSTQNSTDADKDEQVAKVQAQLEVNLKMVGVTAVEDCLQDGVPEAIATIKGAGVRIWVLTGDKTETAVDIAHSCQLFTEETKLAYATDASDIGEALAMLQAAKKSIEGVEKSGLVLDGKTIRHCLLSAECKNLIYDLGRASQSCVCCRLTPLQKRNLVDVVRIKDKRTITLAIGDGANDVPMISGAHLGIAVRGKEGAQAVQVSDVAISQFRFLVPLLLCHGRRAYRKVALFLCYYLYKNVCLLMGDVVWMHMDRYRGRIAFPEYLSINYNVAFTSWHILFVLGFDMDVPDSVANSTPELYLVGPERKLFNKKVFSAWCLCAVYHGCAAWVIAAFMVIKDAEYDKTQPGQFWEGSITAFTIIIAVVMVKLLLHCQSPCKFKTSILPTLGAVFCYVAILGGMAYTKMAQDLQPSIKEIPADILANPNALTAMAVGPVVILIPDVIFMMAKRRFCISK